VILHRCKKEVDATAWLVEDVKRKHRTLPIAVFLLPPKSDTSAYVRAKRLFPRLKGELVPEHAMEQWAKKQARELVPRT
jgi:hypothetical protein